MNKYKFTYILLMISVFLATNCFAENNLDTIVNKKEMQGKSYESFNFEIIDNYLDLEEVRSFQSPSPSDPGSF